jgi:hypothetical protein
MCWEKHASSRSSIFRLHKNTLARISANSSVMYLPCARHVTITVWDRWDLQTDAVERVTKQLLRTHDFRKLFRPFISAEFAD